jgi:hypothetical protein
MCIYPTEHRKEKDEAAGTQKENTEMEICKLTTIDSRHAPQES